MRPFRLVALLPLALAACGLIQNHDVPTNGTPQGAPPAAPIGETGESATLGYPLAACIVSGKTLGEDAVTFTIGGREFRTSCEQCKATIEKDPELWSRQVDAASIALQIAHYPTALCIVSGKPLGKTATTVTHDGTVVRLCCEGCETAFRADADSYVARLDAARSQSFSPARIAMDGWSAEQTTAWTDVQRAAYPLQSCPISGRPLAQVKNVHEVVHNGTLVRLCCEGCEERFRARADQIATEVQAEAFAQQKQNYPLGACPITGRALGDNAITCMAGTIMVRTCCEKCAAKIDANPTAAAIKVQQGRTAQAKANGVSCCGTGESCCCSDAKNGGN